METIIQSKICRTCRDRKVLSDFYLEKKGRLGVRGSCKICCQKRQSIWAAKDPERRSRYTRNSKRKKQDIIYDYLVNNGCYDCGTKNLLVLEFDHVNGKTDSISRLIQMGRSIVCILEEIKKCEVVCRNCHIERTHRRYERSTRIEYMSARGLL